MMRRYLESRLMEVAKPETRAHGAPLADWALKGIRLDGRPFTFEGHQYLRALYDDTSPHVVLMKAAQIGGTTWAILRSIHACLSGLNTMYLFPTRTDVIEFSKSRVRPLIEENPRLAKAMTDTDTAGLKRIGDAYLYLRGMKSPIGIKSVPADMIVFDELDEATPDAKTRAKERLSHSNYKRVIELSNPSVPDYGIDEAYRKSDQRHWTLKCPACGEWTCLERAFPEKLNEEVPIIRPRDEETYYRACPKCEGELDVDEGEWVPDFPDRKTRGYLISQLYSNAVDPGDIIRDYEATRFPERFYNLKVGVAWVDRRNRLHPEDVLKHCGDRAMKESWSESCTMGVDTGRELHVVISYGLETRRRILYVGVHHDFRELDRLMQAFNVHTCVIDGLPETHSTRAFANRWPGQVFLCFFNEHQRGDADWNHGNAIVQVNRTEAMDACRRTMRRGRYELPRRDRQIETFAQHLSNDTKQLLEDEDTGAQRYRYIRTGVNHFGMAFAYDHLAADMEITGVPIAC